MGASPEEQRSQISYWLDYLNSLLAPILKPEDRAKWCIFIAGLGSDRQKAKLTVKPSSGDIPMWQQNWSNLPLYNKLFETSKFQQYPQKANPILFI